MATTSGSMPPDDSRAYIILVATIVTTGLAVILTALGVYVRVTMIKLPAWDYLFNVLGMATEVVVLALVVVTTENGLGRHCVYVNPANATDAIKLLRISEFMLILSTVFVKVSICLFLIRLFLRSKIWKGFLWAFITFNTIISLLDAAFIFPQCTPVELNWNKSIK